MGWFHAHQLQFAFALFKNNACGDVIWRIDGEIFIDVWCFAVGENDFDSIAAIFDLTDLNVGFRFGILANTIENHIKWLTVIIENAQVTLGIEKCS